MYLQLGIPRYMYPRRPLPVLRHQLPRCPGRRVVQDVRRQHRQRVRSRVLCCPGRPALVPPLVLVAVQRLQVWALVRLYRWQSDCDWCIGMQVCALSGCIGGVKLMNVIGVLACKYVRNEKVCDCSRGCVGEGSLIPPPHFLLHTNPIPNVYPTPASNPQKRQRRQLYDFFLCVWVPDPRQCVLHSGLLRHRRVVLLI